MRKLKSNEKEIKEYERFILIEVSCPNHQKYRTTIDKWEQKDTGVFRKNYEDTWLDNNYWKKI